MKNIDLERVPGGTVATIFLLLLQIACNVIEIQNPKMLFTAGKFPKKLEQFANPPATIPISGNESIPDNSFVDIAVVDNGVDYTHPQIAGKLKYSYFHRELVGIGLDLLGNDHWPHPNLINSKLFAFGSKLNEDGLIAEYLDDPLATFDHLNDQFMAILLQELKNDDTLFQKSLFSKITKESFHLAGALHLIWEKNVYLLKYQDYKNGGYLFKPETALNIPESLKFDFSVLSAWQIQVLFYDKWQLNDTNGLPELFKELNVQDLAILDYFDRFYHLVETTFKKFDDESNFLEQYFMPYYRFNYLHSDKGKLVTAIEFDEAIAATYINQIYKAWYTLHSKYAKYEPLLGPIQNFCALMNQEQLAMMNSMVMPSSEKEKLFMNYVDLAFNTINDKLSRRMNAESFQFKKRTWRRQIKYIKDNQERFKNFVHENVTQFSCTMGMIVTSKDEFSQSFFNYNSYAKNPYLDPRSVSISHGTHVAGIILKQSRTNRIVPIRVFVDSRESTKKEDLILLEKFKSGFKEWINGPLIHKAIKYRMVEEFSLLSEDEFNESFGSYLDELIPIIFQDSKQLILFVDQFEELMKYLGENRIKIANLSLGHAYTKEILNAQIIPNEEEKEELLNIHINFLLYEYFKYLYGSMIKKYASQTILVIAAGNDGNWVDGKNRAALPCDISSNWIRSFEKQYPGLQTIPNNNIDNIVCVGSIDNYGDISSFTNILINKNIPFAFSTGEKIKSTVHTFDCSGIDKEYDRTYGILPQLFDKQNDKDADEVKKRIDLENPDTTDIDKFTLLIRENRRLENLGEILNGISNAIKSYNCISGIGNTDAYMSGTSMASPTFAGLLGKYVGQKAKYLGLQPAESYENKQFSPPILIKEFILQGEVFKEDLAFGDEYRKILKIDDSVTLKQFVGESQEQFILVAPK